MDRWLEITGRLTSARNATLYAAIAHGGHHDNHDITIRIWQDSTGEHQHLRCAQCDTQLHQTVTRIRYSQPTLINKGDGTLSVYYWFFTEQP